MLFPHPETITGPGDAPAIDLFADASDLAGAASVQRVRLPALTQGATPHYHRHSTEIFYVIDGALWFLEGEEVHLAEPGTLVAITPQTHHAFASGEQPASALIVLTPGVERFGYFRLLAAVAGGTASRADLLPAQDRFDNHFVASPVWDRHLRDHQLA